MHLNKDTEIYASFSKKAGNNGCIVFNNAFMFYNMNAVYKSFSVSDISNAVQGAFALGFKGFAVSSPYKTHVSILCLNSSDEVLEIGSANTVVIKDGEATTYNTDYLAATKFLKGVSKPLYILGAGGYSKAVQYAADKLELPYTVITRKDWAAIGELRDSFIFNCTPAKVDVDESNEFIDSDPTSKTGLALSRTQAGFQFTLYTGNPAPERIFSCPQ